VSQLDLIPIGAVRESHLQDLIDGKVPENRTLEFKQAGVGSNDNDKREFLKDVTALANTAGGFLIYGMAENEGVAFELKALSVASIEDEILRLQNILLNSVEPRLSNTEMRGIALANGGHVIVIKVPQSWRPPHRITHGNINRFFLRVGPKSLGGLAKPSQHQPN
jgi:predicted HTH transcriptional regulator